MKLGISLTLAALVLPTAASAQNWTADEQSLIDAMEYCWDRAGNDRSNQVFMEACRPTEATIYWWTPEVAPNHVVSPWIQKMRAAWNLRLVAEDLRPIRVQIDGEFGFIFYHGIRQWERADGTRDTESWKGYEVWKRTAAGWSFYGGTGTPDASNQVN